MKDAWGLPCLRATCTDHADDLKTAEFLLARSSEIGQAAGARRLWLFICDGSSLVTSTRGQPTETISALAFRASARIAEFARRAEI